MCDPSISASELNHDLQLIINWAYQWKQYFNSEINKQAVEVLFSKKTPIHPPIFFDGIEVTRVDGHKHFGLILDPTLDMVSKSKVARKNIAFLKQFSLYLPLKTLDQLCKIYIRSHVNYFEIICFDLSITLNTT